MDVLYRPVNLAFDSNPPGTNTYTVLFSAIIKQHPELKLNTKDYRIELIQHLPGRYKTDRTVAMVTHVNDITLKYWFGFNRFRISRYIDLPLFDDEELEHVQSLTAQELAKLITERTGLNIDPRDFLIELVGIRYTGGEIRPNWRLQARPESPFWYGQIIIPLNDGKAPPPPPEPEPEPEPPEPEPEPDPDPEPEPPLEPDPDPEPIIHYVARYLPKYLDLHESVQEVDIGHEVMSHLLVVQSRYYLPCYIDNTVGIALPEIESVLEQGYGPGDNFKVLNLGVLPLTVTPIEVYMNGYNPLTFIVALPPGAIMDVILTQVTLEGKVTYGWVYRGDNLHFPATVAPPPTVPV